MKDLIGIVVLFNYPVKVSIDRSRERSIMLLLEGRSIEDFIGMRDFYLFQRRGNRFNYLVTLGIPFVNDNVEGFILIFHSSGEFKPSEEFYITAESLHIG